MLTNNNKKYMIKIYNSYYFKLKNVQKSMLKYNNYLLKL